MAFKRKDLVFGATSKRMETQHLELVSDDFDKKKSKIQSKKFRKEHKERPKDARRVSVLQQVGFSRRYIINTIR